MKKTFFSVLFAIMSFIALPAQNLMHPFSKGDLWGYRNADGEVVIQPEYSFASVPAGPYGLVGVNDGNETKWGVVEASGKVVIQPSYDYIDLCNEGYVAVYNGPVDKETGIMTGGEWGFLNLADPAKTLTGFSVVGPFIDSVAWGAAGVGVKRQKRTMPIVNDKGKVIGEDIIFGVTRNFNMEDIAYPNEDRSYPFNDGQWVLVDYDLRPLTSVDDPYQMAGSFEDGLAWVKKNGRFGFINTKGEEVIPPIYVAVQDAPGSAPVSLLMKPESGANRWVMNDKGEIAWLNEKGEIVIDFILSDGRVGILDIASEQMWDF